MQEQFQQQLHEQQQKIQLLQAVVEKQKAQIEEKEEPELPNIPLDQLGHGDMSHDAIKMAFSKLQVQSISVTGVTPTLTLFSKSFDVTQSDSRYHCKTFRTLLGFGRRHCSPLKGLVSVLVVSLFSSPVRQSNRMNELESNEQTLYKCLNK